MIFFGLTAILVAGAWIFRIVGLQRRAILVESEIVSVGPGTGRSGANHVFLRYAYQDATGRRWEAATNYSKDRLSGRKIGVLYDPLDPSSSEIEGGWQKWFLPATLVVLGVGLLVVGCLDAQQRKAEGQG